MNAFIFSRLNVKLGDAIVYNKTNRETWVDIKQSVRGKHVFIIQSGSKYACSQFLALLFPFVFTGLYYLNSLQRKDIEPGQTVPIKVFVVTSACAKLLPCTLSLFFLLTIAYHYYFCPVAQYYCAVGVAFFA